MSPIRSRHLRVAACLFAAANVGTWVAPAATAAVPEVSVTLSPGTIGVEDLVTLIVEVSGSGFQGQTNIQPLYNLENLQLVQGPYSSRSFQYVNGRTSQSLTITSRLQPQTTGVARVRDIVITIGEHKVSVADQQITVEPGSLSPPQSAQRNRNDPFRGVFPSDPWNDPFARQRPQQQRPQRAPKAFLRAEATPAKPWVGQQVTYTVALYTQTDIAAVEPKEVPDFHGFWIQDMPLPQNPQAEMVEHQGERYGRVVLMQRALFPLAAGVLELSPYRAELGLRIAEAGGVFGPLFARTETIQRATETIRIEAKALPHAPAGYAGAVGQVRVTAHLDPATLDVGEATTLTVSLDATGQIQGLPEPRLATPEGIRVFPPHETSTSELVAGRVRGARSWSYVMVPERAGTFALPAIEIPYFDPAVGTFAVARAELPALAAIATAESESASFAASAANNREATNTGSPPVGADDTTSPATTDNAARATGWSDWSAWRWRAGPTALGLLAIGGVGSAMLVVSRRRAKAHPSRRAARRELCRRLATAGQEVRPRQAAAAIEEAWRSFLNAAHAIPPGTASTQWADLLTAQGVDGVAASELVHLADDLHYLRYAPQLASAAALQGEVLAKSERLAKRLGR